MLDVWVVCFLGDYIHVVERKVFELCSYKVIFSGFPRDNVREVQPVSHSGGPIKADPQQAQEEEDYHNLQQREGHWMRPRSTFLIPPIPAPTASFTPFHINSPDVSQRGKQTTLNHLFK